MAVGTVSGVNPDDAWQSISSVTASGSSVAFSSLSGYKKYMIIAKSITNSAASTVLMTFNGTSTNYESIIEQQDRTQSGIYVSYLANDATPGWMTTINNADSSTGPKTTFGWESNYSATIYGFWDNTSPITSITLTRSTGTFTGGTITLYGVAA